MASARSTGLRDGVLTLAGIVILLAVLRMASPIVVPFLLSLFVASIAAAPFRWLKRRGVSTVASVVLVVSAIIVVLVVTATMLGRTAAQFDAALPGYEARLNELSQACPVLLGQLVKGRSVDGLRLLHENLCLGLFSHVPQHLALIVGQLAKGNAENRKNLGFSSLSFYCGREPRKTTPFLPLQGTPSLEAKTV